MPPPGADDRAARLRRAIALKRAAARARPASPPTRPSGAPARLGELQRGLWLLQQLDPGSAAYHLTSAFDVSGDLDLAALERAFEALLARHRLLRSTFRDEGDGVQQVVHPLSTPAVERLAAKPGRAATVAVEEARRPLPLETGPLVRLLLIEEPSGGRRLLVLVLHHILADEKSLEVIWSELAASYGTAPPDFPEEPQYDDYVHAIEGSDRERRNADLDYWRRLLETPPEELTLPFEDATGPAKTDRGRLLTRVLDPALGRRVRRLAADTGNTPFMIFAFAYRLLLHRYTGGRRVAFGTPVSLRSHPATGRMVGYFLNPVTLDLELDEELPVGEAVRSFGAAVRRRLSHAGLPFDLLVEELSLPRRGDRHPLFQTLFVHQRQPPPPTLGDLRLEPVVLDLGESKFDLSLFVSEGPEALELAVEFRAERFQEVWMSRLLGHYATLLTNLVDDSERPVAGVSLLSAGEEEELRRWAEGPLLGPTLKPSLPRQILEAARRSPEALALITDNESWSYADLTGAALRLAGELVGRGVAPGDRVALFLDRSPWAIAALLGCHWAGAAYVPLDPSYPAGRNRSVLRDARVAAVLTRARLAGALAGGDEPSIDVEAAGGGPYREPWEPPVPDPDPESAAYLIYTSGSTGRPKGVVIRHGGLAASNEARRLVYDSPPERFLLLPSFAFDSSVAGIFWTLSTGGALILPGDEEARNPARLAEMISRHQVASLLCVPSLYALLLDAADGELASLETAIVAGVRCPPRLPASHFRIAPRCRLFNEYGPTEATVWATVERIDGPGDDGSVAIGRPIPGVRVEVLDRRGRRVPAGVPGEGWISGPTVAQGYWRRPEETRRRFVERSIEEGPPRRSYATGDRLRWTPDGRLDFLGRVDDQVKVRGFRIEPGEIEAALARLPAVEEAAVVLRDDEQLVAFVTASEPVEGWREALAAELPEVMIPARLAEMGPGALPRLANGKVDRRALRETALEADGEAPDPLLDEREQALLSLWRGLLARRDVTRDDNFFRLGGHSLLVVRMTAAVESDFGVRLSPAEVFQCPTIRELARRIERRRPSGAPAYAHLFPIQPDGPGAPFLFAVPHFFTDMVARRFRGQRPVYGLRGVSLRPEGNRGRWPTMHQLGAELVDEVDRRFPGVSCHVMGYSFGATMAVEMARQMEERGRDVEGLYLIAPMALDFLRLGPLRVQLHGLDRPVTELGRRGTLAALGRTFHPLTRRPYRRAWRLLAVHSWRRLLCLAGDLRKRAGLPLRSRILHADVRLERFRLHAAYRPGPVRAPTVIFNPREPKADAAATWRPLFTGPFTTLEIPDPHRGDEAVAATRQLILDQLRDLGGA